MSSDLHKAERGNMRLSVARALRIEFEGAQYCHDMADCQDMGCPDMGDEMDASINRDGIVMRHTGISTHSFAEEASTHKKRVWTPTSQEFHLVGILFACP